MIDIIAPEQYKEIKLKLLEKYAYSGGTLLFWSFESDDFYMFCVRTGTRRFIKLSLESFAYKHKRFASATPEIFINRALKNKDVSALVNNESWLGFHSWTGVQASRIFHQLLVEQNRLEDDWLVRDKLDEKIRRRFK